MVVWPWRRAERRRQQHDSARARAEPPRWVELGSYAGHFDADIDRALLESAGIPVLVKGSVTGLFGPGFSGPTAEGIRLFVPDDRLEDARRLIAVDVGDGE
jgi:hypothetical protein